MHWVLPVIWRAYYPILYQTVRLLYLGCFLPFVVGAVYMLYHHSPNPFNIPLYKLSRIRLVDHVVKNYDVTYCTEVGGNIIYSIRCNTDFAWLDVFVIGERFYVGEMV